MVRRETRLCRLLPIFGAERADGRAGFPHFGIAYLFQFFLKLRAVALGAVGLQGDARFVPCRNALVERLEYGLDGLAEFRLPVERAALGGRRAVGIHPVHAVLADEANEALCQLLYRLVERFARGVSVFAELGVLRFHDARESAHEDAALAREVAVDFVLEGRLEQVARAERDAERERTLFRMARRVLLDGVARVDAATVQRIDADAPARTFGRNEDDVDIFRRLDARLTIEHHAEAVREVERLALGQIRFERRPREHLAGVGNEKLNDRAALCRFFGREERLAGDPPIFDGLLVRRRARLVAAHDIDAVAAHVEGLCWPRRA